MSEPAALERARAVVRHARHCGVRPDQFTVVLTKAEALEVMEWFGQNATSERMNVDLLVADIEAARSRDNPWLVLNNFSLYGVPMIPAESLH